MAAHIHRIADIDPLIRRVDATLTRLRTNGRGAWRVSEALSSPLRASRTDTDGRRPAGSHADPTAAAVIAHLTPSISSADQDRLAGHHTRLRAALALLEDAAVEVDQIITTITADGKALQQHTRSADADTWCTSCLRPDAGGAFNARARGRFCRWCDDLRRALATEWTWEPNTAPPADLVHRHNDGKRITTAHITHAMTAAGCKRREAR